MKLGLRKFSPTKSLKAMTTGRAKRAAKSLFDPTYGVKGVGLIKNPKRAMKNKIYNKTSFSFKDLFK